MSESAGRIRVTMRKEGDLRFLSHLDVVRALKRAFTRARIPAAMSQGFNPQIRIVFLAPLPVGVASRCEVFHFDLSARMDAADVARRLREALPEGLGVVSAEFDPGERVRHFESLFRVERGGEPFPSAADAERLLASASAVVDRRLGPSARAYSGKRTIDVRPFVAGARVEDDGSLAIRVLSLDGRTVRADDVVAAMAGEKARDAIALVTKLEWRPIPDADAAPLLAALPAADGAAAAEGDARADESAESVADGAS